MSDVKQVKVDNWGIYFLQRLKHFFNRTDYCDLTLQFQDNAQLKVHRLVLNACTEYFELLERTCEMYEDCLVMPEDLQADVVVPIVNFMYTGQLEFRMEALDKLYRTSQIMNMPVLSKLLEAHRGNNGKGGPYRSKYPKPSESPKHSLNSAMGISQSFTPSSAKRSYTKAFDNSKSTKSREVTKGSAITNNTFQPKKNVNNNEGDIVYRDKKYRHPQKPSDKKSFRVPSPIPLDSSLYNKKLVLGDPRPTRYELPEELDTDNIFDSSFSNISYASQPLMVHPETTKQYSKKKTNMFNEPTSSKKAFANTTVDIVECKKISKNDNIFEDDDGNQSISYDDMYSSAYLSVKDESLKDPNQLFDQMLDNNEGPKVTIESKDKQTGNLDHAKIISEVLKKYPHLVKSNKNIKLKILNTPSKTKKARLTTNQSEEVVPKQESVPAYTYETDVLDSKEAAKLIAMGAENTKGPWICLICGTPGRALNFTSYYNFRRHLIEVHQEKPVSTICEYCGLKSHKRNYLLHHIYTKHGVPPPPHYHFPKCNMCDYIALTEGFLVKHKLTHTDERKSVRCSICFDIFTSTALLSKHVQSMHMQQKLGNKTHLMQCNYCMKVFMRDNNYFAHLKTAHKEQAIKDGVIVDSDEDIDKLEEKVIEIKPDIKYELPIEQEFEEIEMQYQIQKRNNDSHRTQSHISKKPKVTISNQKILNPGYSIPIANQTQKVNIISDDNNDFIHVEKSPDINEENIVVINDNEYIMKDNQLIPRKASMKPSQYIISDYIEEEPEQSLENLDTETPTTSMEFTDLHPAEIIPQPKMSLKKSSLNMSQPIQIVVSNEEEYKALMASNHSIIFDDSDPNKTLTVLSAAQNPTLNTSTIDLDNTQSNDMMIIQDDYPLSVSEAVSTDNSKYVVVYSHAMEHDDTNKQYQIITSEELGAQYVQSSAVITQNFETITTTTPVVSANVIDTQIANTWPQNDQQPTENHSIVHVTAETELQHVNETNPTHITQLDIEPSLPDLPEVEITRTIVAAEQQVRENVEQPVSVNSETVPKIPETIQAIEENLNSTTESMDVEPTEMPIESISEKVNTLTEASEVVPEHEVSCHNATYSENVDTIQEQQPALPLSMEDHTGDDIIEESSSVPETDNTDSIEPALNIVEDASVSEENTVTEKVPVKNDNIAPVVEAKKQIHNLTSEWSEDEYDVILEGHDNPKNVLEAENPATEEPELEESIENIQQEVQKQIDDKCTPIVETEEENSPEEEPSVEKKMREQEEVVNEAVTVKATQKISSLLNDWEDNDSQEENLTNDNSDDGPPTSESAETNGTQTSKDADNETSTIAVSKDEIKKDEKIKSLVSDWDDDDEEIKE